MNDENAKYKQILEKIAKYCEEKNLKYDTTACEIICPKCKGKGKIRKVNWEYGILFPFAAAFGDAITEYDCDTCDGKGYIEIDE